MNKIEIKCRFSGKVLFSHECENNTIKITLEVAVKADAYLAGANLAGANLAGAYLARANLAGANLAGANLAGAYLAGANLAGANLAGANLAGANLAGATGNGSEVMSFVALEYRGVFTAEWMWIGCRKHPVKTWWKDSEKEADTFTESQKAWRATHKKWIQAMVKASPATPTGHEGK